jgi:hypothetical protein
MLSLKRYRTHRLCRSIPDLLPMARRPRADQRGASPKVSALLSLLSPLPRRPTLACRPPRFPDALLLRIFQRVGKRQPWAALMARALCGAELASPALQPRAADGGRSRGQGCAGAARLSGRGGLGWGHRDCCAQHRGVARRECFVKGLWRAGKVLWRACLRVARRDLAVLTSLVKVRNLLDRDLLVRQTFSLTPQRQTTFLRHRSGFSCHSPA